MTKTHLSHLEKLDRPREKLARYGALKLSNAELLALIITTGTKGVPVTELAQQILKTYHPTELPNATLKDLHFTSGLGISKSCQIIACFELGRRLLTSSKREPLLTPQHIWAACSDIRDLKKEHLVSFCLDAHNQTLERTLVSIGTANSTMVHPREVFEPAIRNLASSVIIVHNHPSGNPEPSHEDIQLTERLVSAGKILGITLQDHVIITSQGFLSFQQRNLL